VWEVSDLLESPLGEIAMFDGVRCKFETSISWDGVRRVVKKGRLRGNSKRLPARDCICLNSTAGIVALQSRAVVQLWHAYQNSANLYDISVSHSCSSF
jgi:hypothetical protein